IEALHLVASRDRHALELLEAFDALGHGPDAERLRQFRYGTDDRPRVVPVRHLADDRLVDLDLVEGKGAQVVERRETGAEVVENQAHAKILEAIEDFDGARLGFAKHGFVDLDLEPARIEAGRGERGLYA